LLIESPIITAKKKHTITSSSQAKGHYKTPVTIEDVEDTDEEVRLKG
jgi:hypothetical protein